MYILFCEKDHLLYIGYSSNLEIRLQNHHAGRSPNTSRRGPVHLIFCEYYLFKEDALKREQYFKTTAGKKAIRLMLDNTLEKLNYKNPKPGIEFMDDDE